MNKIFRSISVLCCMLAILAIAGCYNAGYKSAEQLAATARLGELSDEFDRDIATAIAPLADTVAAEKGDDDQNDKGPADEDMIQASDATTQVPLGTKDTPSTDDTNINGTDTNTFFIDNETHIDATSDAALNGSVTPKVTVTEEEMVKISVDGSDPDGDAVTYTYSPPLDQSGQWQTKRGDAKVYEVYVTATDEFGKSTTKSVIIEVLKANNLPVINVSDEVEVFEGELVTLDLAVFDEDTEDTVESTISGWMNTTSKMTTFDDAGSYTVTLTATDGKDTVSKEVAITVKNVNRAPEFEIVIG